MVRCDNVNSLVDCYIKEDKREELWNLAFDYGNEIDLTKIANYYISDRDSFHICELLSIVSNYLDLDYLFDSIVELLQFCGVVMNFLYFIIINIITFFVYGLDKYYAKTNKFRISEKILYTLSVMGGVVGAILGMKVFRHKTIKASFKIFNFIMLVIWCYLFINDFVFQ